MASQDRLHEPLLQLLRRRTSQAALSLFFLILGVFAGVATLRYLASHAPKYTSAHGFGTFEHGFSTEQILPHHMYQIEQRRFTGAVDWLPSGEEVLNLDPSQPAYVGDPSPAIDKAWDELVETRYWSVAESEARSLWGVGYVRYRDQINGGYTGGFDAFHTLHCLNKIRQYLSPEYYNPTHSENSNKVHAMHCIEQIRQHLQCFSSGTITPTRYYKYYPGNYVDSAQVHTCRNFERLWEYTRDRQHSLKVPRIQWQ